MRILAPAKINVFLRITGQRPDGYHLLDSLMVPISLCDELEIETVGTKHPETETDRESEKETERGRERGSNIVLTCDDPTLPTDETNLAYKAAALVCKETKVQARIFIHLRKHIPAGAGLGGGSSDAAAALNGLNSLLSLGLRESQLCSLATRLGADVPFFVPCRPARVQGIGELLSPLSALPARWFVVVVPPFSVSTPWAYRRFDELSRQEERRSTIELVNGEWPQAELLENDLERAVIPAHPLIAEVKDHLIQQGAACALMSGSGSSVFAMFATRTQAEHAASILESKGKTFVVEPLNAPYGVEQKT